MSWLQEEPIPLHGQQKAQQEAQQLCGVSGAGPFSSCQNACPEMLCTGGETTAWCGQVGVNHSPAIWEGCVTSQQLYF